MIRRTLLVAAMLAAFVTESRGQHHENRFDAIIELTQAKMREFKVPGVAIAASRSSSSATPTEP